MDIDLDFNFEKLLMPAGFSRRHAAHARRLFAMDERGEV